MKKLNLLLLALLMSSTLAYSQQVNGVILDDTGNITIVKTWGTHSERGFAYGYLMGNGIKTTFENYFTLLLDTFLVEAKTLIQDGIHIKIDSIFHEEAKAIINGMDSAGIVHSMDYLDILAINCLLDLSVIGYDFVVSCSSFMSWGSATAGTGLNGKSVISRYVDWSPDTILTANQVMVIHIPSEIDEQPWLMIGFSGLIGSLSGTNNSGVSAFVHTLTDTGSASYNMQYEPIWFSTRKGLERTDFNSDGKSNVNDIRDALSANTNGYPKAINVSSLAPSSEIEDTLIALVAELTPKAPTHTYRSNLFFDSIPGDNLYNANDAIKRNNSYTYCSRYDSIINCINTSYPGGVGIGAFENRELMKSCSNTGTWSLQFIQVIPENRELNLSVFKNGNPAYMNNVMTYDLDSFFSPVSGINELENKLGVKVYPNLFSHSAILEFDNTKKENYTLLLYNAIGQPVREINNIRTGKITIKRKNLNSGLYFYSLQNESGVVKTGKIIIQ